MSIRDIINPDLFTLYNIVVVVLMLALSAFALTLLAAPLGTIGGMTQVI